MEIKLSDEAASAIRDSRPVVALESTVIAHGLPYPQNLETAHKLESIIREIGAVPATIAVFNGEFRVGLGETEIEFLATEKSRFERLRSKYQPRKKEQP